MSDRAKRDVVRGWLESQSDEQLRQAVFALQLLYNPGHLALLFGMAARASR